MILNLALAAIGLGILLACLAAGGRGTARARRREADRRLRQVARNPERVNSGDVHRLLTAHDLPQSEVRLVLDKAAARGIRPLTMWMWGRQFGVHSLAVVVAADVTHQQMLGHLADGTLPDLAELRVFAALNGLTTVPAPEPPRRSRPIVRAVAPSPVEDLELGWPGTWEWGPETLGDTEVA